MTSLRTVQVAFRELQFDFPLSEFFLSSQIFLSKTKIAMRGALAPPVQLRRHNTREETVRLISTCPVRREEWQISLISWPRQAWLLNCLCVYVLTKSTLGISKPRRSSKYCNEFVACRLADPEPAETPTTHRLTPRVQQFLWAANTALGFPIFLGSGLVDS